MVDAPSSAAPNGDVVDAHGLELLRLVVQLAGATVFAIGSLVLIGWAVDASFLKSLRPGFVSMKANTALALALSGLALLVRHRAGVASAHPMAALLPAAVTVVGVLSLLEYLLGVDLGIDELLFPDPAAFATSSPGRMAPQSAMGFALMGTAMLLAPLRRAAAGWIAQIATLIVLLLSFLSLVGYLYGADRLQGGATTYTRSAPHTLVAFLFLGAGVLASTPQLGLAKLMASASAGGLLLRRMLPICLAVQVTLGALRLWGQQAGLYDAELGPALFATSNVAVICALLVWVARDLTRQHLRRQAAESDLRLARDTLEVRVAERTRELAQTSASLRRSEETYRTLMQNLPNGAMLQFDHDLRYQVAEGAKLLTSFGYSKEQLLGKTLYEVATPEKLPPIEALYQSALAGRAESLEIMRGEHTLVVHAAPVRTDDGTVAAGMVMVYDITALKKAEQAATRSEDQFRRLVEAIPDMVAVVRDHRFVYLNPAGVRLLGYDSADELVGSPVENVLHADEHPSMDQEAAGVLEGRSTPRANIRRARRRDGGELIAEYITLPMEFQGFPSIVAVAKDVTDRRRAEAAARDAASLWRAILDSANYTIISTTPTGVIREFNAAAERMLGYTAAEVVNRATPGILHDPAEVAARAGALTEELGERVDPGFEAFVAKARRGGSDENEWTYIRKDGSRFPVRLSVTALRDPGGVVGGFLGIGSDITEQQRSREELVRAKEAAEQAMRARADFLARMSHEIRTPMNGVLGMTALALETVLSPEQRDYVGTAHASARGLLELINDILDFSKIDSGKLRLEQIPFRTRDCCRAALRGLAGQAKGKGLELLVEIAPDVPPGLIGDPQRLQQVLTNLAGNAVKFTDRGTVAVQLTVADRSDAGVTIQIEVTDTGIGIPREKWAAIFEAFNQADEATTRRFGGTGLGLAITSQLVELMGGKIWVDSEPGQGSRFSVQIPMPIDPEAPVEAGTQRSLSDLPALRVLVAEDNPVNRKLVSRWFERAGHQVVAVENGQEALTALAQDAFDLVLMDVQMPGMDGLEATRTLRASEVGSGRHVPVIAVTAQAMKGDRDTCLAAGMDAYVTKPLDVERLVDAVEEVLRERSRRLAQPEAALDHRHLLERIDHDAGLMTELFAMFRADLPRMMGALATAVASADAPAIARTAHTLRGALLSLSARPAARLLQELEERTLAGEVGDVADRLAATQRELDRVEAAMVAAEGGDHFAGGRCLA